MKKIFRLTLLFLFAFSFSNLADSPPFRNVMYYGDWSIYAGQKNFYPSMMQPKYLTHLNFAFLDMDSNGDLVLVDEYADFQITSLPELEGMSYGAPYAGVLGAFIILKIKNPHIKLGISVGGWGRSANFPGVAADPVKRQNFATNIVKFIDYIGYDFVDIDWEYPTTSDTINFNLFLQEIRNQLNILGEQNQKYYELSIATSAAPSTMAAIQYDKVLQIVDFANMMTYDFTGSWNGYTGHHTGLYTNEAYNHQTMPDAQFSADNCIKYLQSTYGNTIDMKKVIVGVAPYTKGWSGVQNDGLDSDNPGLFATATNGIADTFGFYEIPSLMQQYNLQEYFDNKAKAAYYYSPTSGTFFTCDNDKSADAKGQYVQEKGLGGLIAWMASLDRENVVTKAMFNSLYEEGHEFPDDKMIFKTNKASASIVATKTGYDITIQNNEVSVETNVALKDAEKFQINVIFMKLYIKTRSGAEFSEDSMSGTVINKDGIGIVDPSSNYDAQNISPGGSYTFSVKVSNTPDVSDIESISMTQRILPTLKEIREQIVYKG